jgi:hypothetical protein
MNDLKATAMPKNFVWHTKMNGSVRAELSGDRKGIDSMIRAEKASLKCHTYRQIVRGLTPTPNK